MSLGTAVALDHAASARYHGRQQLRPV